VNAGDAFAVSLTHHDFARYLEAKLTASRTRA
jgi:hypothetical protein